MRENVKIHHPVTGGKATVDARAVPIWQGAGWLVTGGADASDTPPDSDAQLAATTAATGTGARSGRTKTPAPSPASTDTAAAGSSSTEK